MIEIPDTPVRIIEHVIIARRCGVCGKQYVPKVDLSGQVVGKHRIGIRPMSLIGHLNVDCRLPARAVQGLLETLMSLFHTWKLRGLNPMRAYTKMLVNSRTA